MLGVAAPRHYDENQLRIWLIGRIVRAALSRELDRREVRNIDLTYSKNSTIG